MSKIAENKAREAYPDALIGNIDNLKKDGFIKGYNQAMQDFMEKAEKVFYEMYMPKIKFELFKQYMENKYFQPKDKDTSTIIERSTK